MEEHSDPLIPAQDLTGVATPCWLLGDLFNEDRTERRDLEDDPVIPAQDVGLHIFDDMPGFALAKSHLAPTTAQNPHPTASAPKSEPPTVRPSDSGSRTSLTTTRILHIHKIYTCHGQPQTFVSARNGRIFYWLSPLRALGHRVRVCKRIHIYEDPSTRTAFLVKASATRATGDGTADSERTFRVGVGCERMFGFQVHGFSNFVCFR